MDATHSRLRSAAEWVAAAGIIAGVVAGGSVALQEFKTVAAVMPVSARESASQVPTANVPDRSVSVPVLLLPDDVEIRVGDAASDVMQQLSGAHLLEAPSSERGPNGVRETRVLERGGTRFVLVIESFQQDSVPRVAAIYLH